MTTRLAGGSGDTMETNQTPFKLIDPVIAAAFGGVAGAAYGGIGGMLIMPPLARRYFPALAASTTRAQYARMSAQDWSAFGAAGFGVKSLMEGIRGKDDLTTFMVSGAGAGFVYSFATKDWKLKPAHALSWAAALALLSGSAYKVREAIRAKK